MKESLQKLVNKAKSDSKRFEIIFLNNVGGQTATADDYKDFSVFGEYLKETEAEEIYNSLLLMDFKVEQFNDEIEFIKYALNDCRQKMDDIVILNMAQKGTKIGRKSLVPAFCDMESIYYTGSNPYVVSLCRNKYHTGCILEKHGITSPKSWLYVYGIGWLHGRPPQYGKIIAKPNNEACSMGVDLSNIGEFNDSMAEKIVQMSKDFCQDIIVQEFISGYEVEVPCIVSDEVISLIPVGINFNGNNCLGASVLTYEIRVKDLYEYFNFYDVSPELADNIRFISAKVMRILGITGFGRVDFRVNKDGCAYVIDIATNPHITKASSFAKVFELLGFTHPEMIGCLIALAE
jgi:D-alanine-D-alanine ligase